MDDDGRGYLETPGNSKNKEAEAMEKIKDNAHTCEFCGKSFKSSSHLGSHKFRSHKELLPPDRVQRLKKTSKTFKCSVCNKMHASSSNLKQHMRSHVEKNFKCDQCNRQFSTAANMNQHVKQFHEKKPLDFQCDLCDKSFPNLSNLYRHVLQAHVEDKEFQCMICLKKFVFEKHLKNHMKSRHFTEKIQIDCDQCFQKFKTWKALRHHCTKVHERFDVCRLCFTSFPGAQEVEEHRTCESKDGKTIKIVCPKENCSVELTNQCLLAQHFRQIHRSSNVDFDEVQNPETDVEKIFQCSHCSCSFTRKLHLHCHEMSAHPNVDWTCNSCDKTFKKKYQLSLHEKIHLTEANFSCPVCENAFTTETRLRLHIRIHDEDKPHKCHLCAKSFVEHWKLQQHLANAHQAAEKPFKCPHCPARFFNRSALHRSHIPSHFDKRPFRCSYCSLAFKTKAVKVQHERDRCKARRRQL